MIFMPYIGLQHPDDIKVGRYIGSIADLIGWLLQVIGILQTGMIYYMTGVKTGLIHDLPDAIKHRRIRSLKERAVR